MNPDRPTPELAAPVDPPKNGTVRSCDFRNPMLLSIGELRRVRLQQEKFSRSAAARLSTHLRSEFSLSLTAIETVAYPKLAESWGRPSHLTLFKMEPVRGVSVLEISAQLGLCMVDRLMGGPGQSQAMYGETSELEKVLLEQTAQLFLDEWCGAWHSVQELKPVVLGYESNGGYIQTITPETIMLVVSLAAGFGGCGGKFQIGVPHAAMKPLIHRFCQGSATTPAPPRPAPVSPRSAGKWNAGYNDVCVPVTAEWEAWEMTAGQIAAMKVGDVLPMEAHRLQQINVRVADTLKFQGRPGMLAGQWAVELTQVVNR